MQYKRPKIEKINNFKNAKSKNIQISATCPLFTKKRYQIYLNMLLESTTTSKTPQKHYKQEKNSLNTTKISIA